MSPRAALTRPFRGVLVWSLAAVLVLSACSGDGDSDDPADADGTSAASDEPYLPVPDWVELTEQGSELELGDLATVAYEPRQEQVGVLDLTVTKIEKATFELFVGWKITDQTKETTPYFVHVEVENTGETDLGGLPVPVYAVDGDNRLVRYSTFASSFKPCPSEDFPKTFENGDELKTCLVYLAPDKGEVTAASFRPDEEFDPIVWTGEITEVKTGEPGKGKGGKKKGKGDKQG